MELRGPSTACSNTSLVDGDFSGGADIPTITTTFDESSSNIVAGTPTAGTYNPSRKSRQLHWRIALWTLVLMDWG